MAVRRPVPTAGALRISADVVRYYATHGDGPMTPTLTPRRPHLDRDREAVLLAIADELDLVADVLGPARRGLWARVRGWGRRLGRGSD